MKIGYLCYPGVFTTCGPGSRTASLLRSLHELGHQPHVRAQTLPPQIPAVRHGIDEQALGEMARDVDICIVRLDGSCHAERLAEQMLAYREDLPLVLEIHSPLEEQLEYRLSDEQERIVREQWVKQGSLLRRRLAAHGAAAIGVSKGMVEYAQRDLGITRAVVIPNSADPQQFTPHWPRPDPFLAFWAGAPLYPWQAVDIIIDAAKLAPDLGFFLACSQSDGLPSDLPRNIRVGIALPPEDIMHLYARTHAALVLYHNVPQSRWGFYHSPLKLYEALAAGTPVIGSPLGEIPDVIRQADCGYIIENTPAALVDALRHLQQDPSHAEHLGRSAYAYSHLRTWRHVAAEVAAFCVEVLDNPRSS